MASRVLSSKRVEFTPIDLFSIILVVIVGILLTVLFLATRRTW
jgi:hypothetical protein